MTGHSDVLTKCQFYGSFHLKQPFGRCNNGIQVRLIITDEAWQAIVAVHEQIKHTAASSPPQSDHMFLKEVGWLDEIWSGPSSPRRRQVLMP
jgi:hypothetical protein